MDLWYGHQGTFVYMLTKLPAGSERKLEYDSSGWPTFERCCAELIKRFSLPAAWGTVKLVLNLGEGVDAEARRHWPCGPDDFDALVKSKKFMNDSDMEAVQNSYREMSTQQARF